MLPNMSRFNPMGHSSSASSSSHAPAKEPKETKEPKDDKEKDKDKDKHASMGSIASMSSLTTKLAASLHTVASAANPLTPATGSQPNVTAEIEKKAKQASIEKKQQIAQVLTILEDVHLQCPQSHSGIIVAYTGSNCTPIMNNGIKFTWFRMSGEDQIDQLEESAKAWYAPTVDDIGSVICLQCEDNFYQGCSRYIECGPIKADSLLCSLADSAVENGTFETNGVAVSLGISMASANDASLTVPDNVIVRTSADPALTSILSKKMAFLQFDGRSTVEVDEQGIFISIPTFDNTGTALGPPAATDKRPERLPGKRRDIYAASPKPGSREGAASPAAHRQGGKFKAPRRGLRIPASIGLKVGCAHPQYLVLSVPVKREDDGMMGGSAASGASLSEEERMRRFLSSSTVSIPWTYEGHNHSPEAYANSDPNLTYEEKQELIREAERDSVIFANTVCALAEFISSLPEGTNEIRFCFSCPDRLVRDTMVLSIRALAALPSSYSRYERKSLFPWVNAENPDKLVAESTDTDALETKRVLKAKEEENATLKRERNELTVQLLESREELVSLKSRVAQLQGKSMPPTPAKKGATDEPFNGFPPQNGGDGAGTPDIGKAEAFKQLSSKIIELENKLSIATKKEAEATKARSDIEARNTSLHTDLTKSQRQAEDLSRKVASLQSLNDAQTQSITLLEKDQEKNKATILEQEMKLRELDVLRVKLEKTQAILDGTSTALEKALAEGMQNRATIAQQEATIKEGKDALVSLEQEMQAAIEHLQLELNAANERIAGYEEDAEAHKLVVAERDRLIEELEAANAEKDRLCGEINHLQQKSESLSRDLKKHMKDSSAALAEFEKALVRKSEECNDLYLRLHQWEKAEEERLAAENNNLGQRIFRRIGSIHLPEGLGIAGRASSPGVEDDDHHSTGSRSRSSHLSPLSGGSSNRTTPNSGHGNANTGSGGGLLRGMSGGRKSLSALPGGH